MIIVLRSPGFGINRSYGLLCSPCYFARVIWFPSLAVVHVKCVCLMAISNISPVLCGESLCVSQIRIPKENCSGTATLFVGLLSDFAAPVALIGSSPRYSMQRVGGFPKQRRHQPQP